MTTPASRAQAKRDFRRIVSLPAGQALSELAAMDSERLLAFERHIEEEEALLVDIRETKDRLSAWLDEFDRGGEGSLKEDAQVAALELQDATDDLNDLLLDLETEMRDRCLPPAQSGELAWDGRALTWQGTPLMSASRRSRIEAAHRLRHLLPPGLRPSEHGPSPDPSGDDGSARR